jgi:uncharacterized protein YjlB
MKSLVEATKPVQNVNIVRHLLADDGTFPNNGFLPLLVYREAFQIPLKEGSGIVKEILETNSWTNAWEDGIYDYHHYHSTAHEVLVVIKGSARVQFGGPQGVTLMLEVGDVVIIPAGVAHKRIDHSEDFTCVGAYPGGQIYDMNYGKQEERERAENNIKALPRPENDPIYGNDGPLIKNWEGENQRLSTAL